MKTKTKATKPIDFKSTKEDRDLIGKIVIRGRKLAKKLDIPYDGMDMLMDITAVHLNGNPLRLDDMLKADEFNFGHDLFGIRKHIDRRTGELLHFFSPRFSARQ